MPDLIVMPDMIGHLLHFFLLSYGDFLFDHRFPVKPGRTVVDGIRDRLFGDGDGRDGLGLRQQGLAGGDSEGNGLGAGR
jgi:hypothetical protein